jgi:hypothetical protein
VVNVSKLFQRKWDKLKFLNKKDIGVKTHKCSEPGCRRYCIPKSYGCIEHYGKSFKSVMRKTKTFLAFSKHRSNQRDKRRAAKAV